MNETYIVTSYCIIDDLMSLSGHESDTRSRISDSEIIFVAVIAAKYFQNHHERAVQVMVRCGDIPPISVSRFNRRLHALSDWVYMIITWLNDLFLNQALLIIDSLPLPVCKRARARRCGKVRGREFCGYCAAKKEKFFGWRLHLVCTPDGLPVRFDILPAAEHDLTPIHELTVELPADTRVLGDKAYLSAPDTTSIANDCAVHLVATRRKNMAPLPWPDDFDLRHHRRLIETVHSQLVAMNLQSLRATSNRGFFIKTWASLIALTFTNLLN